MDMLQFVQGWDRFFGFQYQYSSVHSPIAVNCATEDVLNTNGAYWSKLSQLSPCYEGLISFTSGHTHAWESLAGIVKSQEICSWLWPAGKRGQYLWGEGELACTAQAHF